MKEPLPQLGDCEKGTHADSVMSLTLIAGREVVMEGERQSVVTTVPRRMAQLLDEIEDLQKSHGIRVTAAVALVAERHGVDEMELTVQHFEWCLESTIPSI